jgi:hydrogenase expression/formation protein HypE
MKDEIRMAHGSGGSVMAKLISGLFMAHFDNPWLNENSDSAVFGIDGREVAMTTDSFVVDPLFFPGADIGKLAVCGTLNDLAVAGAKPQFMSAAFILEEGLPLDILEQVVISMARQLKVSGVKIVTGDTKVVNRGKCDKLFINTTGVGKIEERFRHIHTAKNVKAGDRLIINGTLGDHGIAVLLAREKFSFRSSIQSDCADLYPMISGVLELFPCIAFIRDATRGGLAAILHELSLKTGLGIIIDEATLPLKPEVRGITEMLGLDPLYVANEGKAVMVVPYEFADDVVSALKQYPEGRDAAIIGKISPDFKEVILETNSGGRRILDHLSGDLLPRIC